MNLITFLLTVSFLIASTARAEISCLQLERNPQKTEIEKSLTTLINGLDDESVFNVNNCNTVLLEQTQFFFTKSEAAFINNTPEAFMAFTPIAADVVNLFWQLKMKVRKKLQDFYQQDPNNPKLQNCVNSFRDVYRYIRYAEESINEWYVNRCDEVKAVIQPQSFAANSAQLWVNSEYFNNNNDFTLQSGDVLLTRGSSFVSAAISRIGDVEGQFSHLAIVYQDPQTKRKFIIEALIETGTKIYPLADWIQAHQLSRLAIFRYKGLGISKEQATYIAEQAGKSAFTKTTPSGLTLNKLWLDDSLNLVSKKQQNKIVNKDLTIRYDFPMDNINHSTLFCSEVVGSSYEAVTGEKYPTFKTQFSNGIQHPFFESLTVSVSETFAPSDIELDPRFDLIGEWRNPFDSNVTKLGDATFNVMFQLMFQRGYEINGGFLSDTLTDSMLQLRKRFNLLASKMPPYIPKGFARQIRALGPVYDKILASLNAENSRHINKYGYNLTYPRAVEYLKSELEKDCARSLEKERISRNPNTPRKKRTRRHIQKDKEKTLGVHDKFNVQEGTCWNPLRSFDELSDQDWQQMKAL